RQKHGSDAIVNDDIEIILVGDPHAQVYVAGEREFNQENRKVTRLSFEMLMHYRGEPVIQSAIAKLYQRKAVLVILGDAIHPDIHSFEVDDDNDRWVEVASDMVSSVAIMDFIFSLKIWRPDNVYYIVGNHDVGTYFYKGGVFQGSLFEDAVGRDKFNHYQEFIRHSPLILLTDGLIATHAGPLRERTIKFIEQQGDNVISYLKNVRIDPTVSIANSIDTLEKMIAVDFMWNRTTDNMTQPQYVYHEEDLKAFLEAIGQPNAYLIVGHTKAKVDSFWMTAFGKPSLAAEKNLVIMCCQPREVGYISYVNGSNDPKMIAVKQPGPAPYHSEQFLFQNSNNLSLGFLFFLGLIIFISSILVLNHIQPLLFFNPGLVTYNHKSINLNYLVPENNVQGIITTLIGIIIFAFIVFFFIHKRFLIASADHLAHRRVGILTSGGPASGHNAAIYAALKEANKRGIELIGIKDGWQGLVDDDLVSQAQPLKLRQVRRHRHEGGTILGTKRANPYKKENIEAGIPKILWTNIQKLELDGLITCGGDDTNSVTYNLQQEHPEFLLIGLPKTMDNDIAFPEPETKTYGFDSFSMAGTKSLQDGIVDARSTGRILITEVFGRKAGFAPLRIGANIEAARTLIPEEENINLEELVNQLIKYHEKHGYGVVVVSEGVSINPDFANNRAILSQAFKSDPVAKAAFEAAAADLDDFGNPKLKNAGLVLAAVLKVQLKKKQIEISLSGKIDYLHRSADASKSDYRMCSVLGKAAIKAVISGQLNKILYVLNGNIKSMPLVGKLGERKVDYKGVHRREYLKANQAITINTADDESSNLLSITAIFAVLFFSFIISNQFTIIIFGRELSDYLSVAGGFRRASPPVINSLDMISVLAGIGAALFLYLIIDILINQQNTAINTEKAAKRLVEGKTITIRSDDNDLFIFSYKKGPSYELQSFEI
ncbi:MAG: 6-phosphofructokinase, partial [Candidatus Omnitrophica bacterium]|nr:6-phosphofructokinase [Candidatus Omnitrophota bacterium]